VTLIVIAVGLSGVSMAGWAVNHLDLAPPYAGKPLFVQQFIILIGLVSISVSFVDSYFFIMLHSFHFSIVLCCVVVLSVI